MKITKEWIEKVIRHNRPGIAAAQIMQEIEKLKIQHGTDIESSFFNNPATEIKDKESSEWETPRERVFRLGRNI